MRKKILWVAAALALIAIPAVIGLVALRGDDSSSEARRSAALVDPKINSANTTLTLGTVIPGGKAIDVMSFSWGMSQSGTAAVGGGAGAGKVTIQDISITKTMDESSPNLMQACASGQHIPAAKLTMSRNVGGKPQAFAVYDLTDVIISKVSQSRGGADLPTEEVTLNFAQVKLEYTGQDEKTGTAGLKTQFGWNLKTNVKA